MEVLLYFFLQLIFSQIKFWLGKFIAFSISLQPLEVQQYSGYEITKLFSALVLLLVILLLVVSCLLFAKSKNTDRKLKRLENSLPDVIEEKQKMNILKDGIE